VAGESPQEVAHRGQICYLAGAHPLGLSVKFKEAHPLEVTDFTILSSSFMARPGNS
jgi:hypothetical protein